MDQLSPKSFASPRAALAPQPIFLSHVTQAGQEIRRRAAVVALFAPLFIFIQICGRTHWQDNKCADLDGDAAAA